MSKISRETFSYLVKNEYFSRGLLPLLLCVLVLLVLKTSAFFPNNNNATFDEQISVVVLNILQQSI